MQIYTVVLDYAGGTYISQVKAPDEHGALRIWIDNLGIEQTAGEVSDEVAAAFNTGDDRPVFLEGLVNAWCASAPAQRGLALVNMVQTAA